MTKENTKSVKSEPQKPTRSAVHMMLAWLVTYVFAFLVAMFAASAITGMNIAKPGFMSMIAVICSLVHPGGWLAAVGFIAGIMKRTYTALLISILGGALTGASVPYLDAVGVVSG